MSEQCRKNARSAIRLAMRLHEKGRLDEDGMAELIQETVDILWEARRVQGVKRRKSA